MCTNLLLSVPMMQGASRMYVSARALELSGSMQSSIYLVPRAQSFPLWPPSGGTYHWTNKYGFVGIASPQKFATFPCFMDGLNEVGLSAAALWLPGTVYPTSSSNHTVTFSDFVAWMLGNYAKAADIQTALTSGEVDIVGPSSGEPFAPLHFIATDATGASVVIELVNGVTNVYGPAGGPNGVSATATSDGVLTNAPTYDWQRTNLQNFLTLNIIGPETSTKETTGPVVGSGLLGMPGDPMSQSRFVRAATLRQGYDPTFNLLPPDGSGWLPAPNAGTSAFADAQQTAVNVAMQLVQMVMQTPYGTTLAPSGQAAPAPQGVMGDWTMWCTVRGHTDLTYYYTSAFNGIMRGITVTPDLVDPANAKPFPYFQSIPILPSPELAWYEPVTFS